MEESVVKGGSKRETATAGGFRRDRGRRVAELPGPDPFV